MGKSLLQIIVEAVTGDAVKDLDKVERELGDVSKATKKTSRSMDDLEKAMSGSFKTGKDFARGLGIDFSDLGGPAELAGKAVRFLATQAKEWIGLASDMNETTSKVGVIFGDSAEAIEEFTETAATGLGQSQKQAMDAAATFAVFGKSAGLAGGELVDFSTTLVSLSADLASFSNTSPEEAITAIGAALRGESEPIRRYGVLLDDATLRQKALTMGIIDTVKEALTPQQRALAAYQVILDQTGDAQGDFTRTSGGLANQTKILDAQIEDLKTTLGEGWTPAAIEATKAANSLATAYKNSMIASAALADARELGLFSFKDEVQLWLTGKIRTEELLERLEEYERQVTATTDVEAIRAAQYQTEVTPAIDEATEATERLASGMWESAEAGGKATEEIRVSFEDMAKSANQNLDSIIENMMADMQWIASGGLELQQAYKDVIDKLNMETLQGVDYAAAEAYKEMQALQLKSIVLKDEIAGISTTETAQQIATNMGIPLSNALELVKQIRANAQFDVTSYIRIVIQEQTSDLMRQGDDRVGGEVDLSGGDEGPGGANGLDMIVPQGYPNDSYNVRATSGERVTITPEETGGGVNYGGVTIVVQGAGDPRAVAEEVNRVLGRQARIAKLAGAQYGGI